MDLTDAFSITVPSCVPRTRIYTDSTSYSNSAVTKERNIDTSGWKEASHNVCKTWSQTTDVNTARHKRSLSYRSSHLAAFRCKHRTFRNAKVWKRLLKVVCIGCMRAGATLVRTDIHYLRTWVRQARRSSVLGHWQAHLRGLNTLGAAQSPGLPVQHWQDTCSSTGYDEHVSLFVFTL